MVLVRLVLVRVEQPGQGPARRGLGQALPPVVLLGLGVAPWPMTAHAEPERAT